MNHDQKNAVLKTAFDQFNNEVAHLVIVFKSQVALENDKAKGIQITENSQNIRKSILADWNNIHSMYTLILSNAELDSKSSDTAEVLQPIQTILNKLAHNESRFKDHEFQFPYLVAKLLGKVKSVMQKYAIINNPNMNGNLQSSNNNNGPISTANVKHAAKKFEKVAESVAESNLKLKRAQTKATAKPSNGDHESKNNTQQEREVLLSPNTFQSMLEDLEISKAKTIKKQLNVQLKSSISSKSHSKADSNVSTIESLLEDNKSIEVPASNKLANQNLDTLLTDLSQFKVGSMEFNSVLQDDFEEPMRNKYTTEKLPLKVEIKQHIDALSHEPNYNTDDKNSINQPVPDQVTTTIKQNELAISTSALKIDDLNSTKRKTCRTPVSPNDENPFRGGTFQASPVSSLDQKATPVRAASLRIQRPKPDKIEGPRSADTAGSHNSVLPIKASVKLFAGTNNAIPEESQQNLQSSSNQIIMPRFSQTKPQIESSRVDHPDKSKTPVLLIDQTTNNESQSKSPKIAFQIEQEPHSKPRNSAIQKVLKVDEDKGMSRIGSADSFKTIIRLDNPTNDYLDESKSMESQDSKVDDDQKIETSVIDKPTGLSILDNYENDDSVNQELNSALYTSPNITSPMELSAFGSKYTAEHVENYLPSLSLGTQMNLDFQNNMDMPSLQRPNTLKRADLSKPKPLDVQTNLTFEITPSVMNGSTIDSTFKANADNSVTSPVPKVNRSTKPMKGNSQDTDELAKLKRLTFQVAQRRQDIASVVFTDKDYLLNILSTFGTNSNALVDNDEDDENMTNLIAKQLVEIPNPSKEQLVSESKKNEQPVNYNKTMKPTESITATTAVDARLQERMSLLNNRAMGKPAPPGPPPRNPLDVQKGTTDNLATHHTIKSNTPIPIGVPKSKTNKPENNAGETLEDTVTMGVSQSKVFDPERSNFQYFTHELYEERDEVSYIPIIPTFQVMDSFQLLLIPLNGMFDIKVLDLSIPNRMGRNNTTNHPAFKAFGTLVVSRNHIDIFARNEKVYIKDIGSNSGTFRNNARLSQPGLESPDVELWTGDYIQLGKDFVQGEEPLDSNGRIQARRRCIKFQIVIISPGKTIKQCIQSQTIPIEMAVNKSDGEEIKPEIKKPVIESPERNRTGSDVGQPQSSPSNQQTSKPATHLNSPKPSVKEVESSMAIKNKESLAKLGISIDKELSNKPLKKEQYVLAYTLVGTKFSKFQISNSSGTIILDINLKQWDEKNKITVHDFRPSTMGSFDIYTEAKLATTKNSSTKAKMFIENLPWHVLHSKGTRIGQLSFINDIKLELKSDEANSDVTITITGDFKQQRFMMVKKCAREQRMFGECKGKHLAKKTLRDTNWLCNLEIQENEGSILVLSGVILVTLLNPVQ